MSRKKVANNISLLFCVNYNNVVSLVIVLVYSLPIPSTPLELNSLGARIKEEQRISSNTLKLALLFIFVDC